MRLGLSYSPLGVSDSPDLPEPAHSTGFNRLNQSSAGLPFSVTPSLNNALPVVRNINPFPITYA